MNENSFWLRMFLGLATIFTVGLVLTLLICRSWDKLYIQEGYVRATLPGYDRPVWVKQ